MSDATEVVTVLVELAEMLGTDQMLLTYDEDDRLTGSFTGDDEVLEVIAKALQDAGIVFDLMVKKDNESDDELN